MEWISVDEQMPEQGQVVLISSGGFVYAGFVTGAKRYPFAFLDPDEIDTYDADDDTVKVNAFAAGYVTHWTPLPDPHQPCRQTVDE